VLMQPLEEFATRSPLLDGRAALAGRYDAHGNAAPLDQGVAERRPGAAAAGKDPVRLVRRILLYER
jgi:hypothetical protein